MPKINTYQLEIRKCRNSQRVKQVILCYSKVIMKYVYGMQHHLDIINKILSFRLKLKEQHMQPIIGPI